jgi:hypothetical protein
VVRQGKALALPDAFEPPSPLQRAANRHELNVGGAT